MPMSLDTLPDWPGAMKRKTAAAYLDMGEAAFMRLVEEGIMPQPFWLGRSDHWTRASLDRSLAALDADSEVDWRTGSPLYAK